MGRMLGAFDDNQELDRPDLNKCPDCGCYFDGDNCPLCGKECPENMRAGNRPAVKKKRQRRNSSSGRVTFVDWYHSWWFIAIAMLLFPIAGIILLITSPHKLWKKILFIIIGIIYFIISTFGIGNFISDIGEMFNEPVDSSLTREEYIEKCETVSPEKFYRSADGYKEKFVSITVRVTKTLTYSDNYYADNEFNCYLCEDVNGSEFKIIVRDCLLADKQKFISGDVITIYGEGAGQRSAYDSEYTDWTEPCLNMAYVVLETE
ncbi:MAG: hypothetical protein E7593_01535 [Ruminococcaceae bacterium]|nr:hypothetical protein [Oscillospiraceae bacterium]